MSRKKKILKSANPSAVATRSGKQTHSEDGADSGVQVITPAAQGSFLLAKDPNRFLWKPYVP